MTEDARTLETLRDEDITTVIGRTSATAGDSLLQDTDGTDENAADGVDGDGTDTTDGDSGDADGTDGQDADGTDGDSTDTDGTDQ
jgi:hypothetical protein